MNSPIKFFISPALVRPAPSGETLLRFQPIILLVRRVRIG